MSGRIGEAWFEIGVPPDKFMADLQRAHTIARTETEKIQRTVTDTMRRADMTPGGSGRSPFGPTVGRTASNPFQGIPVLGQFGSMGGPALGIMAGSMAARTFAAAMEDAQGQRNEFIGLTGRLPGAGDLPGGTSKEFDYGVPVIGPIIKFIDELTSLVTGAGDMDALAKATESGTVGMLKMGKALDNAARSLQQEADLASAGSDGQRARMRAEHAYADAMAKAADLMSSPPKGMSFEDWRTYMGPKARAMGEAAEKVRDSQLAGIDRSGWDAVERFGLAGVTDPMSKELDALAASRRSAYEAAAGNNEALAELDRSYEERRAAIWDKYRQRQLDDNADFFTQQLRETEEFLKDMNRALEQADRDRAQLAGAILGGTQGPLVVGLDAIDSRYDAMERQYADNPKMLAAIRRARQAESAREMYQAERQEQQLREGAERTVGGGNFATFDWLQIGRRDLKRMGIRDSQAMEMQGQPLTPAMRRRLYRENPRLLDQMDESGRQSRIDDEVKRQKGELSPQQLDAYWRQSITALEAIKAALAN
jgi:hypothetical protein